MNRLLPLLLLGAAAAAPVPWPYGVAPTPVELDQGVSDALSLARRERLEELSASRFVGEERDVLVVPQRALDSGQFDLEAIFQIGDAFFSHEFRVADGYGGMLTGPPLQRVHTGLVGGLDTFSCAGCHSVGGNDGAGSFTQNANLFGDGDHLSSAAARNPPALLGLGLIQALAAEMSAELGGQRDAALTEAKRSGQPQRVALRAKGVDFGALTAHPDGRLDLALVGVSADLVVRPFGWKGDVDRLRRFIEEAARLHFGAQTTALEERAAADPARIGTGPLADPDGDGVSREIEGGALSATAAYLAMLETPAIVPPADVQLRLAWALGDQLFSTTGCDTCHVRTLKLVDRTWVERADGASGAITLNLLRDGDQPRGDDRVPLFSDLKRHDMGPNLADHVDHPDGIPRAEFLTRPLWGLAETAPYLHDGRALTLDDAILAHGGEGQAAADAFAALSPTNRASLTIYLLSLSRTPKLRVTR